MKYGNRKTNTNRQSEHNENIMKAIMTVITQQCLDQNVRKYCRIMSCTIMWRKTLSSSLTPYLIGNIITLTPLAPFWSKCWGPFGILYHLSSFATNVVWETGDTPTTGKRTSMNRYIMMVLQIKSTGQSYTQYIYIYI